MLKVSGVKSDATAHVEIDQYVPLTIELNGSGADIPLYWRGRTGEDSLIEVGVSPSDGSLHSITLTSISSDRVSRVDLGHGSPAGEAGVPKVELSFWPAQRREFAENFVDEVVSLQLFLGEMTATVCFSQCAEPASWLQLGNVLFGITADRYLCCIEVRGLSAEQMNTIGAAG